MFELFPSFDDIPHDFYYSTACEDRYDSWLMDLDVKYPCGMVKTSFAVPTKECTTFEFEDGSVLVVRNFCSDAPSVVDLRD